MADTEIVDLQPQHAEQQHSQHTLQQDTTNNTLNNNNNSKEEQQAQQPHTEEKEVQKEEQEEVTTTTSKVKEEEKIKMKMIQAGNEKEEQKEEAKQEEEEEEEEDEGDQQKDEAKEDLHPPCTVVMIVPTPHGVTSPKLQPQQQAEEEEEEVEATGQLRRESTTPTTTPTTSPSRMMPTTLFQAGPSAFANFKDSTSSKRSQLLPIPKETEYLNKINNNHNNTNNNFDNTLTPTITLQTGPSPAALLQATLSASQQHPQHPQQAQQSATSSAGIVMHNKDLWLEVSMHAHIVSNLAAMAQGQRLSSPPLEMIRSHLNHINNKVKELGYLYPQSSTLTPPSLSPPSSGSVPFSYPPGMTLNGWVGSESLDEYRPDLRSSNSKVSNFASAQSPGWFNSNNTHNTLTRSTSFSSPSTSSSSYGLTSASSASAPSTPHNSGSPPLTSPSSPSTTPSSPLRDSIDESAAAAILSSSRFLALSPTPSPSSTSGGVSRPMGGHHFHHYSVAPPASGRYPNSGITPIHRPLKFSPHRIPGSLQSAAELPGHRSAFTATSAHVDVSLPQGAGSPGRSSAVSTKNNSASATALKKRKRPAPSCDQCHTMYTPEWRRGPRGAGTLCNACGLRYSRQEKRLKKREEHLETKKKASIDAILNP